MLFFINKIIEANNALLVVPTLGLACPVLQVAGIQYSL